jgi:hypothetical protein
MAPSTEHTRPVARRLLSREIVKVPRAIARRTGVQVARCQYALRPSRSPADTVRRALAPGADVASFRTGAARSCRFFFAREESDAIVESLELTVPGWRARTLAAADRICEHDLRLLGADSVRLGAAIPWHRDVLNGYDWRPRTFYKQVPVPYDRADMKVPWELARSQHLATLGMAYRASRDERYARELVAQIDDFIARNRPGYGINWVSAMDVAIRAVNWLWAYELVADSGAITEDFATRLVASLVEHARHIEENISVYEGGVTTNHTVAEYAGLAWLGLMLPELRWAQRWADAGISGLTACMEKHTTSDGVDYENSIGYHRLVTEMYLTTLVLAERNGRSFPAGFRESLERMVEFVVHYTQPDGMAPLVGDADDGRWHLLADYYGWEPRDHRHLLGTAAAVFGRQDFASAAHGSSAAAEEAAWLVGPEEDDALPSEPLRLHSRAFQTGGRYVMRHGDHHAIVSADEVGTDGFGNHKHNDILGYELVVGGRPAIVDCGSYLYLSDRAAREAFRSTRAHNTVVVDQREQNAMPDPFRTRPDARVQVHHWHAGDAGDVLDASHTGYELLPEPVRHRRRLGMRKGPFAWLVVDSLEGTGEHDVESFVHLAPDLAVAGAGGAASGREEEIAEALTGLGSLMGMDAALTPHLDVALAATRAGGGVLIVPLNWGELSVESGWVAPRYGRRLSAPVVRMHGRLAPGDLVGYLVLEA